MTSVIMCEQFGFSHEATAGLVSGLHKLYENLKGNQKRLVFTLFLNILIAVTINFLRLLKEMEEIVCNKAKRERDVLGNMLMSSLF